jgi:Leucine-rich repeat (LRR) protein
VPIKRLPASLTTLANLQILDLDRSSITELPSDMDRLRCLRYLSMYDCDDLQCLPCSISGLTSLQELDMSYCSKVWDKKRRWKKMASLTDLSNLTQLKVLRVQNNGETISGGTFGSMLQMETLHLRLTLMTDFPEDIFNMSKLRRFTLECSHVVKMESKFSEFHNLTHFQLWNCASLEELPDLHKLSSLKYLVINKCPKLKKFPREFTELGAFPSLEIFSLVYLNELEELPLIKEGAMSMLKVFTMMECEVLKLLPKSFLNLKTLQKIRVYSCPMV